VQEQGKESCTLNFSCQKHAERFVMITLTAMARRWTTHVTSGMGYTRTSWFSWLWYYVVSLIAERSQETFVYRKATVCYVYIPVTSLLKLLTSYCYCYCSYFTLQVTREYIR